MQQETTNYLLNIHFAQLFTSTIQCLFLFRVIFRLFFVVPIHFLIEENGTKGRLRGYFEYGQINFSEWVVRPVCQRRFFSTTNNCASTETKKMRKKPKSVFHLFGGDATCQPRYYQTSSQLPTAVQCTTATIFTTPSRIHSSIFHSAFVFSVRFYHSLSFLPLLYSQFRRSSNLAILVLNSGKIDLSKYFGKKKKSKTWYSLNSVVAIKMSSIFHFVPSINIYWNIQLVSNLSRLKFSSTFALLFVHCLQFLWSQIYSEIVSPHQ